MYNPRFLIQVPTLLLQGQLGDPSCLGLCREPFAFTLIWRVKLQKSQRSTEDT